MEVKKASSLGLEVPDDGVMVPTDGGKFSAYNSCGEIKSNAVKTKQKKTNFNCVLNSFTFKIRCVENQ